MKIGLATTTINVPHVLALLHQHGPDVGIFVAGDLKTPEPQCADFVNTLGPNAYYLSVEKQKSFGYACSDLIGWSNIQRRNIAILECLKWGADIIVTWDDDNLALNSGYFSDFEDGINLPFSGLKLHSRAGWVDPGQLLEPQTGHRGFPTGIARDSSVAHAVSAKVGVVAGLCLGNPDIDATVRIATEPQIRLTSVLANAGIVVDNSCYTVYNSQNSAFIRELAPAMLLAPQFKRYDDIFASLVTQRVMRERGYHVRFGAPFVFQQRNPHDYVRDLEDEVWGMRHVARFAAYLDSFKLAKGDSVLGDVQTLYARMNELAWMPAGVGELAAAWAKDCERVLA